jgi:phospholipid/cholesterol/gamma-HCH transport system permease protein
MRQPVARRWVTGGLSGVVLEQEPEWVESTGADGAVTLFANGAWTVGAVSVLDRRIKAMALNGARQAKLDLSGLTRLDTAGAWLLYRTRRDLAAAGIVANLTGLDAQYEPLLDLVEQADLAHPEIERVRPNAAAVLLNRVGKSVCEAAEEGLNLLNFLGVTIVTMLRVLAKPRRMRIVSLVNQIEQTGLNAMGIVGLLLFMIGVVLAFQSAEQLRKFAAEIFTADGLAILVLREIGVLIAAILIAGRSGSAFTAEIGMMKVNEEIDALRTTGVDPVEVLVLPRINALLLTLPLLTFFANVAALTGGTIMAVATLDVTYTQFVRQLADAMTLKNFIVGMVKAPVFAFLIGLVGCYEGLQVSGSAESIGRLTTKSVVESIVLVILADATFSIVFAYLGI